MDFAEVNPLAGAGGSPELALWRVLDVIENIAMAKLSPGTVAQNPAQRLPLPDDSVHLLATDPPYYDAIPYADLMDYFYVWQKRVLKVGPTSFDAALSPKDEECIVDQGAGKDQEFYERNMKQAFQEARRVVEPKGIAIVVFAHKTTAGWESLLQALVDSGWTITASWPIDTEMGSRMRANSSAVLASSIHLVCRPRENSDGSVRTDEIGDWRDVLQELPRRIHEWMPRLAEEGVVGADAIFACLGPALEIFSRYSRVEKASGETVSLKEYLEQVWAAVAKEALAMIFTGADATGFEEDARLTAMWLWTLSTAVQRQRCQHGTKRGAWRRRGGRERERQKQGRLVSCSNTMPRERSPRALGAHLEQLASLIEVKGATARLLPVAERTRSLFQKGEAAAPIGRGKAKKKSAQLSLGFVADLEEAEAERWMGRNRSTAQGGDCPRPRSPVHDPLRCGTRRSAQAVPGR